MALDTCCSYSLRLTDLELPQPVLDSLLEQSEQLLIRCDEEAYTLEIQPSGVHGFTEVLAHLKQSMALFKQHDIQVVAHACPGAPRPLDPLDAPLTTIVSLVRDIVDLLFQDGELHEFYDPDKECDSDTIDYVVDSVVAHGLGPYVPSEGLRVLGGDIDSALTLRQALLAQEVYRAVLARTESFEATQDDEPTLGAELAYLLGAILEGTSFECRAVSPLATLLRDQFPPEHVVWRYVEMSA